jgi:hypothetical protein
MESVMLTFSIENRVKTLNEWDTVPIASTLYSGPSRVLSGVIQIVVGAIFTALAIVFGSCAGLSTWKRKIVSNAREVGHGVGNIVRGCVATIPLGGNGLICLYEKCFGKTYYLRRDSQGFLIIPDHPELKMFMGAKTKNIYSCSNTLFIDTKNGVIPRGWVYEPE